MSRLRLQLCVCLYVRASVCVCMYIFVHINGQRSFHNCFTPIALSPHTLSPFGIVYYWVP